MDGLQNLLTTLTWAGVLLMKLSSRTPQDGEILCGPLVVQPKLGPAFLLTPWIIKVTLDGMNLLEIC